MCGISGIINLNNLQVESHIIKNFNDIISHRGPDDDGFYYYNNVAFGHRRLSILDLSLNGHQPMHYAEDYCIVFNGEIYNYLEIKEELLSKGYTFNSQTDTEVILAAYDLWQDACVEKFNGMWAFSILDKKRNILFCSRDRFGVKPFYYRVSNETFAFASEIKQFTVLPDWKAIANKLRLTDFITSGIFDHTDETLFNGVFQLKGGHNLIYNLTDNTYRVVAWYELAKRIAQFNGTLEEATKRFNELFQDAVRLRLRSDVKVGSCLSGGLDSSSIVCTVNKILRAEDKAEIQETVSSCFNDKRFDEQEYIDEVSNKTEIKSHKIFPAFDEMIKQLESITWHQDEPFGSTSIFAQWSVFKEAKRNNLIVMLDGQGADEILAGYQLFFEAYFSKLITQFSLTTLIKEYNNFSSLYNLPGSHSAKRIAKTFIPQRIFTKIRKLSSVNDLRFIKHSIDGSGKRYEPEHFIGIRALSLDLVLKTNLPMLLHYEDRNSMAHSIESRVPFLDYRLVEFCIGLPDNFKILNGETKFVLRESMAETVPDKIRNRHDKKAFVTPETQWIKDNKVYFTNLINEASETFKDYLHIDKFRDSFENDIANLSLGSVYWRLISLNIWAKKFNIQL